MTLSLNKVKCYNSALTALPKSKLLISTLNAHCYNEAQNDPFYLEALVNSDVLIPDGISIVWALKWLTGKKLQKIAGADLFGYEMERLQQTGGKCFFLGSSESTLKKIKERASIEYPNVHLETYSPPFRQIFSEEENEAMLIAVNKYIPDVLFVGMTAPKQEKWAWQNYDRLETGHICCIGAVFDFYSRTINRAPQWMIKIGLEWFYRLVKEPKKMWRRYLIGNIVFIWHIVREKIESLGSPNNRFN